VFNKSNLVVGALFIADAEEMQFLLVCLLILGCSILLLGFDIFFVEAITAHGDKPAMLF
jgi:hypothetical protein